MKTLKYALALLFLLVLTLPLAGCKKDLLETPVNITIDEDNNLIWDKVNDAKSYQITFNYIDDGTVSIETTRRLQFSLSDLLVGDYEITIKAIPGEDGKKESKPSDILYFHKYFETGCVYTLINNKTEYEITKVGRASGSFEIEDFYRGKAVTRIADKAFKGSNKVNEIIIGANVQEIGENAFYNCSKLTKIILPESVRTLGKACFQSCKSLTEIEIPKSILNLPDYCFAYCRTLEKVILPETMISIGESSFSACSALLELNIPNSVKTIGLSAFYQCDKMEKVTIGNGVEIIPMEAFYACRSLKDVSFNEGSSLKRIDKQAFINCISLEEIELPSGLNDIDEYAFNSCSQLKSVKIPESVNHIGVGSFAFTSFYNEGIENNDQFIYADNWLIYANQEFLANIVTITTETLSNTIIGIADNVFYKCPNLKTLVLPASFKYIGKYAFAGCPNLWKITTLDDSIELIDDWAFASCAITSISLGIGLKRIGKYAFYGNTGLDNNSISPRSWIPESVTSIGTDAFRNTMMYNKAKNTPEKIVYAGNWVVGVAAEGLRGSINLTFDTDRVAGIADYAFYNQGISSIQGLSNARYIGKGAFSGCQSLVSVSLNRNLTEIRDFAFEYCGSLIKITLPRTLKSVGDYAFYECASLSEIDFSQTNVETIGKSVFYNDVNLVDVKFGKNLKSIGDFCFIGAESLKSINIPDKVETIGESCFYNCVALEVVTLGESLKSIPDRAFFNCSSIRELSIPGSVKTIGRNAFYKNTGLKTLKLDEGVEEVGDYAFFGCDRLASLEIPSSLSEIGNLAFKGSALTEIHLPGTIKKIGQHAFYGSKELTIYTELDTIPSGWHERFNSSNRPLFWGVCYNDDGSVDTVIISKTMSLNIQKEDDITEPHKTGDLSFKCFVDEEGHEYSLNDLKNVTLNENGECKLKAVYELKVIEGDENSPSNE